MLSDRRNTSSTRWRFLKKNLKEEIGWFGSANAQAHITVFNFDADAAEMENWKKKIARYCDSFIVHGVVFNHFDSFHLVLFSQLRTIYQLNNLCYIKNFQHFTAVKPQAHAHLCIGRSLDIGKLEQAKMLFKDVKVNFEFICGGFVFRRFDFAAKRYLHNVAKFDFKGRHQPDLFILLQNKKPHPLG